VVARAKNSATLCIIRRRLVLTLCCLTQFCKHIISGSGPGGVHPSSSPFRY
jgi:hypothetical protein